METVVWWQNLVASTMPPAKMVVERNASINAHYASWYKSHPFFKWAGMASFSSRRVGLALSPYRIIADADKILKVKNMHDEEEVEAKLMPDLDLLRRTNNAVFKDLGWAHEAYAQRGFAAVASAIGPDARYQKILQGMKLIDEGLKLHHTEKHEAGEQKIWEGNVLLLLHEQLDIIQPFLPDLSILFDRFLSAMTVLQFWVNPLRVYPDKMTVFYLAMCRFEPALLLRTRSLPDFRNFEQRWLWITKRVVPIFQRLDGHDPEIMQSIDEIIRGGPSNVLAPLQDF